MIHAKTHRALAILAGMSLISVTPPGVAAGAAGGPRFEMSFPASLHAGPITGRVFIVITHRPLPEPRFKMGDYRLHNPFFGEDVENVKPGQEMEINSSSASYPFVGLRDVPAGHYYVQALLDIYTKFHRADGHTIWAHMDQGEGQDMTSSPGNLYSEVVQINFDPSKPATYRLTLTKEIPPIPHPRDTEWVKHIRIKSEILTKWWGRPMYLGAAIVVPKGYEEHPQVRYPVLYFQGHSEDGVSFLFSSDKNFPRGPDYAAAHAKKRGPIETPYEFYQEWIGPSFPRMFLVTWYHATPFYDDSYDVNSANDGPYGNAILKELIPYIESHFRIIRQGYARVLTGGSTGGWESLALQVYHPSFFGGTWTFDPDPVDLRSLIIDNIYTDDNAFTPPGFDWTSTERPFQRDPDTGQVLTTMRMESRMEAAMGSHGRSTAQFDVWDAAWGPVGPDGYPESLWNKETGVIDRNVAQYMRDHGYDLTAYLQQNWSTIGAELHGKIHLWCGDMDDYYLNLSVYRLQAFLEHARPAYGGTFTYGDPQKPHGWHPMSNAAMFHMMADQIIKNAPPGTKTDWLYP